MAFYGHPLVLLQLDMAGDAAWACMGRASYELRARKKPPSCVRARAGPSIAPPLRVQALAFKSTVRALHTQDQQFCSSPVCLQAGPSSPRFFAARTSPCSTRSSRCSSPT